MLHRLALAAAFALAALSMPAEAQTVQIVTDCSGVTAAPGTGGRLYTDQFGKLCVAGGSSGTSQTGSVTPAGTNGTQAQAVQGITGGVPMPVTVGNFPSAFGANTQVGGLAVNASNPMPGAESGSSASTIGIVPVLTQSGTSVVGKAAAGNLYSAYAVNTTATAGYLACINATAAPTAGAAITPLDVASIAGVVGSAATINYGAGPPNYYSTGITCLVTTSLTTYTAGGAAFMQVRPR